MSENSLIKFNLDTFLTNFRQYSRVSPFIDISLPVFESIWPSIEDDMIRAGLKGTVSSSVSALTKVSPQLVRVLKHGFKISELGYAQTGIIPVVSTYEECLSLSNLAQRLGQRMSCMLLIRSQNSFRADGTNENDFFSKISGLPSLDLTGLFFRFAPQKDSLIGWKRLLREAEAVSDIFIAPYSATSENTGVSHYTLWENLALAENSTGSFPLEISFKVHFVRTENNCRIFQSDIGLKDGLPADFPARISIFPAKAISVCEDYCEFALSEDSEGLFLEDGYLTGGETANAVDIQEWKQNDLKRLLFAFRDCPVVLIR